MVSKSEISYIKPGLAVGGASMADVELLKLFSRMGKKVDVSVGYIDKRIQIALEEEGFKVTINPMFDRYTGFTDQTGTNLLSSLTEITQMSKLTIISQSFLGDADLFNMSLSELLNDDLDSSPKWLRSHDHIRDNTLFENVTKDGRLLSLPTTKALEAHMKMVSPNARTEVLPYYINCEKFRRQSNDVSPKSVRDKVGIGPDDFVIFQPSRVDPRKRVGKAVCLAAKLQEVMPDRKVILLVAGGGEPIEDHKKERSRLEAYASKLNYSNLVFLNGLTGDMKYRRVSDYMRRGVADLVTFMSEIDAFGLPPLESCVAGLPCVTSSFKDEKGYPAFTNNYPGFDFIVDDGGDNLVDDQTIEMALKIAKDRDFVAESLENNLRLTESMYGEEAMRDNLRRLFDKYNL